MTRQKAEWTLFSQTDMSDSWAALYKWGCAPVSSNCLRIPQTSILLWRVVPASDCSERWHGSSWSDGCGKLSEEGLLGRVVQFFFLWSPECWGFKDITGFWTPPAQRPVFFLDEGRARGPAALLRMWHIPGSPTLIMEVLLNTAPGTKSNILKILFSVALLFTANNILRPY